MQRGLGEAAPPKGVSPMSDCRGFPHSRFAWLTVSEVTKTDQMREVNVQAVTYSHTEPVRSVWASYQHQLLLSGFARRYANGYKAFGHAFAVGDAARTRTVSFINDTGCPDPPEQYKNSIFSRCK
ncbi:MAG: hypothetical protein F6K55_45400 [Moorea sp. SIO4A3]|nr:hypothetical protein [Moorena sp. SIO4A3]